MDTLDRFGTFYSKVYNFHDILFAFLYSKPLLKRGKITFLLEKTLMDKGGKIL